MPAPRFTVGSFEITWGKRSCLKVSTMDLWLSYQTKNDNNGIPKEDQIKKAQKNTGNQERIQGGGDWGNRSPKKLRKWLHSPWFCTLWKTAFAMYGHFAVYCLVTAALWRYLHPTYSGEPVIRLDYHILLEIACPNLTGRIHPCWKQVSLWARAQ